MFRQPKIRFCRMFALQFNAVRLVQAVELVIKAAEERRRGLFVTPNVDHIVLMESDSAMRSIFQSALGIFVDGVPLLWLSKFLRFGTLPERVNGTDLFMDVCASASKSGKRVFLLGGAPGTVEKAAARLVEMHPGLVIAGVYCPPFGFEHNEEETNAIIVNVNRTNSDILCIGVGTPKQEKWAFANLARLKVGPILCIGASLDFAAGAVRRCPRFLGQIGFEWLWRLASEPRRLWRRYLVRDSVFLLLALREIYQSWVGSRLFTGVAIKKAELTVQYHEKPQEVSSSKY